MLGLINAGFTHLHFQTYFQVIGAWKKIKISDFWPYLPCEISKEDPKAVSQYVAKQFGQAEGFIFTFCREYSLSKRANSCPSEFTNFGVYEFEYFQKWQTQKLWLFPYGKTRNCEGCIPLISCIGTISVIIPLSEPALDFDISVDFQHTLQVGYEWFGMPVKVWEWIKDHARSPPQAMHEELMKAIMRRESCGVTERYLSTLNVHYWWKKLYRQTKGMFSSNHNFKWAFQIMAILRLAIKDGR